MFIAVDLSALGGMTALLELDASYNDLTELLAFTPPNCLKIVKMSQNKITKMADLSAHHYLHHLDLDGMILRTIKMFTNNNSNNINFSIIVRVSQSEETSTV